MKLNPEAAESAFCLLMDDTRVFSSIDPRFQSFSGVHMLCRNIRDGTCEVYMYGTYEGKFGLVWCFGNRENGRMELHLGFERGVKAEEACRLLEREILEDHPWVTEMGSLIPADNRSVQVLALHLGYGAVRTESHLDREYIVYNKEIERDANE